MSQVLMYTTAVCPYCVRAKQLLTARGVASIDEVRVDLDPERREEMMQKNPATDGAANLYWRDLCWWL